MKTIIAENLKQLRIDRGLDKNLLATYLDVTPSTYTRYENGSRTPDLETLLAISNYYGCTINDLMTNQELTEGVARKDVLSYRDLREYGLNDKLSHGLVKQVIDNHTYKEQPVLSLDNKVKFVYKSDVITLLTDIVEMIEQCI
ncbi:helix-turn-helix domain-containing protein [Streptococcus thoraltensis]|uniref:helix-turn-helix domain-containing protein n=1 Tax=Streptococcus thoraltensis TaxID=55085 RepID=UPI001F58673F|nr:helix-turn-helix transcriptional regulator [Streptococcus thoraltensis]